MVRRALEGSWAQVFAERVFPAIDESRFEVLYGGRASRPNTPANVVVGALIIKELFGYSDDASRRARASTLAGIVRLFWGLTSAT